jgi:acetylornithine deacetylase/succinyl-diaminopimelate desuccinylase-like protein
VNTSQLRERIVARMPQTVSDLETLVRIPSLGYPGYDPAHVRESAEATREILGRAGFDARLLELDGGHPAVFGEVRGPDGSPTVLLYAHHDVQPEGPLEEWRSPPFEPVVKDGRMFGRGTSDDKCGIVAHAAAVAAWGGSPPATVKVVVEGEEECTTEHLPQLVEGNADLLRADVAVVADSGNYRNGVPTITTSLRAVTDCVVEVRVLAQAQHSGSFGGPIPDAYSALVRMLSRLHDDQGNVAIPDLKRFRWTGMEVPEQEFREEAGLRGSVKLIGSGSVADRLWAGPAVSVLGIDGPRIQGSSNQLVPVARARVSLRLAPNDDPVEANRKLVAFLKSAAPWGVEVSVREDGGFAGRGFLVDTTSDAYRAGRDAMSEAWGRDVIETGTGGSIPLVAMLSQTFPGIAILLWGASDERSYLHSVNESVDLAEVERLALAEALLIGNLTS